MLVLEAGSARRSASARTTRACLHRRPMGSSPRRRRAIARLRRGGSGGMNHKQATHPPRWVKPEEAQGARQLRAQGGQEPAKDLVRLTSAWTNKKEALASDIEQKAVPWSATRRRCRESSTSSRPSGQGGGHLLRGRGGHEGRQVRAGDLQVRGGQPRRLQQTF